MAGAGERPLRGGVAAEPGSLGLWLGQWSRGGWSRLAPSGLDRPGLRLARRGCSATHLPLALVVERQAKGVAKGDERPLHGIGFRLLDGGFMGKH